MLESKNKSNCFASKRVMKKAKQNFSIEKIKSLYIKKDKKNKKIVGLHLQMNRASVIEMINEIE